MAISIGTGIAVYFLAGAVLVLSDLIFTGARFLCAVVGIIIGQITYHKILQ